MNQKPQDARDVLEYTIATFLGAAAVMLVGWFGKRFLDVDTGKNETFHIHLHSFNDPDEELLEPENEDETCDCPHCKGNT